MLFRSVYQLVENLNVVIDKNDYPLEECKRSNMKHRPIGIGVQGLADVFMEMLEMYDSDYSSDGFISINPGSFSTYNPVNASIRLVGSGFSSSDDWYNGRRLLLEKHFRTIIDYDGATKTAFLDRQFETNINQINILTKTLKMDNRPLILGMGIIANVEIVNGGTGGYAVGDKIGRAHV